MASWFSDNEKWDLKMVKEYRSKREIGIELRSILQNEFSIAHWAYEKTIHEDVDSDIVDILYSLSFVDIPGFEYAKEELELLANLLILNLDNLPEKFLPMRAKLGFLFYKDKANLANKNWFIVALSKNLSVQKLYEELAFGLQLPKRFSDSSLYTWLDALEWLTSLDWIVESKILIVHDDIPLENNPVEQKKYFELLSDLAKAWYGDERYGNGREVYFAFPEQFSSEVKNLTLML